MDKTAIYLIIETAIFLIPLATVLLKVGKVLAKVEENTERIVKLEDVQSRFEKVTATSLQSITESLHQVELSLTRLATKIEDSGK